MEGAQQRVDLREVNRNDLLEAGDPTEPPACVVFVRQYPQRDQDVEEANVACSRRSFEDASFIFGIKSPRAQTHPHSRATLGEQREGVDLRRGLKHVPDAVLKSTA